MSGFTQHIDSPFPDENILFNSASGLTGQQLQKNQLAIQGQQMDLTAADHEQVARLSAALLNEPDLGKRADLYSRGVGMLQSQNLAKYAPPTLPDESTLRMLAAQGTPSADLYKQQLGAKALDAVYPGPSGTTGIGSTGTGTGTTPAGGGRAGPAPFVGANLPAGVSADEDQLVRTVYGEAGGEPVAGQQAVAHVIKTRMKLGNQGVGDVVFAPNQFEAWSDPKNRPRMEALDPSSPQYQAILNGVVRPVLSGQAQDPTGGATNFYNPALQAQLGRSTPGFAQGNRTTIGNHEFYYGGYAPRGAATASAAPATAPAGGGGTPGSYQVASTAPTAPPGPTAAPGGPPAAQFKYSDGRVGSAPDAGGGVHFADGNYGTPAPGPSVPVAAAAPTPAATTAATPPAATTAPAQPAPAPASLPADQLLPQDHVELARLKAALAASGRPDAPVLLQAEIDRRRTANVAAQHQTMEEQRQAKADALAAEKWHAEQDKTARDVANPFGDSPDGKLRYILSDPNSDPKSSTYHAAWAAYANPQTANGVTMPGHVMAPFRMPLDSDGQPVTTVRQAGHDARARRPYPVSENH